MHDRVRDQEAQQKPDIGMQLGFLRGICRKKFHRIPGDHDIDQYHLPHYEEGVLQFANVMIFTFVEWHKHNLWPHLVVNCDTVAACLRPRATEDGEWRFGTLKSASINVVELYSITVKSYLAPGFSPRSTSSARTCKYPPSC